MELTKNYMKKAECILKCSTSKLNFIVMKKRVKANTALLNNPGPNPSPVRRMECMFMNQAKRYEDDGK